MFAISVILELWIPAVLQAVNIASDARRKPSHGVAREGVENRVEFRLGGAQNLPFENAFFDVVICESVNAFIEDKQRAISEYVRVTKPGGYVGL